MQLNENDPLRCIVIDENAAARNGIQQFCNMHPRTQLLGKYNTIEQAIEGLNQLQGPLNLVFWGLDRHLDTNDLNFKKLPGNPSLIIMSRHKEMAYTAFECNALYFLHKPIDYSQFKQSIERAIQASINNLHTLEYAKIAEFNKPDKVFFKKYYTHLLLNRANRLANGLLNYVEPDTKKLNTNPHTFQELMHLQLQNNHKIATMMGEEVDVSLPAKLHPIEPLLQNVLHRMQIYMPQNRLQWDYTNNLQNAKVNAYIEILSLIIEQTLSLLIRFAPINSTINISIEYEYNELKFCFEHPDLVLDESTLKIMHEKSHDLNSLKYLNYEDSQAINYFLNRMDGYAFTTSAPHKGTGIYIVLEGQA
jgi:DNA-binding NarL/FixJ family response regulator